ncbi:MAG: DDE-type integrase/transposase/recombinase [Bacteroidota bacterium]
MAIRAAHPRLSARKMYSMLQPEGLDRDQFEAFCLSQGYRVSFRRAYHRTTNSYGVKRFPNLLLDKELTGVNQAWVGDITYYRIGEQFYYLTLLMDLWSRYLVGYGVSSRLLASQTSIRALQMAFRGRGKPGGLILHSDGGGQYYSNEYLSLTAGTGILHSMGSSVYENGAAERLNGIIKSEYLSAYYPRNYGALQRCIARAVRHYNERPHQCLGLMSPQAYEQLSPTEQKEKKKQKKKNTSNNNINMQSSVNSKTVNVF